MWKIQKGIEVFIRNNSCPCCRLTALGVSDAFPWRHQEDSYEHPAQRSCLLPLGQARGQLQAWTISSGLMLTQPGCFLGPVQYQSGQILWQCLYFSS